MTKRHIPMIDSNTLFSLFTREMFFMAYTNGQFHNHRSLPMIYVLLSPLFNTSEFVYVTYYTNTSCFFPIDFLALQQQIFSAFYKFHLSTSTVAHFGCQAHKLATVTLILLHNQHANTRYCSHCEIFVTNHTNKRLSTYQLHTYMSAAYLLLANTEVEKLILLHFFKQK